jgi:hypothetical protein
VEGQAGLVSVVTNPAGPPRARGDASNAYLFHWLNWIRRSAPSPAISWSELRP